MIQLSKFQNKAQTGFEPVIFGLRDRRLTTWPLRQISVPSFGEHQLLLLLRFFPMAESLKKKKYGSGGIRTHASEETGALNQRLRPLGHATSSSLLVSKVLFEHSFWRNNCQGKKHRQPSRSLWRNRLARSAVNRKVGGSSPPRDGLFFPPQAFYL